MDERPCPLLPALVHRLPPSFRFYVLTFLPIIAICEHSDDDGCIDDYDAGGGDYCNRANDDDDGGEEKSFGFLSIITINEDGDDDGVDCNDDDVGEEKSFGFLSRQLHNRWPLAG